MAKPAWVEPGVLVWYYPTGGGTLRFAGTVLAEPYLLGGHTWVCDLGMSAEYTAWHPAKRTKVNAAACDGLMRRFETHVPDKPTLHALNDDPSEPVIHLKLPLSAGMLVALENLAALVMNDEVPFLEGEQRQAVEERNKNRMGELRELIAAYRAFHEGVSKAIVIPPVDNATDHVVGVKA